MVLALVNLKTGSASGSAPPVSDAPTWISGKNSWPTMTTASTATVPGK